MVTAKEEMMMKMNDKRTSQTYQVCLEAMGMKGTDKIEHQRSGEIDSGLYKIRVTK